ncbi:hypothetical protein ACER0A_007285 [Haloimpatiens sp. FM7315]|uniref:hypothetical protein n=1 Tax=Haloimpatiens sp. FM7315 TaxID=3298609 RepID=UPI00370BC056
MAISKVLIPGLGFKNSLLNQSTHIGAAYLALALIGIHVGLHWSFIINTFKYKFRITKKNKYIKYISKCLAVLILVFGIYNIVKVNYFSKTAQLFNISSEKNHEHGFNGTPKIDGTPKSTEYVNGENKVENGNNEYRSIPKEFHDTSKGIYMKKVNFVEIILKYMSIMAVFVIPIYYIGYFYKNIIQNKSRYRYK